MTIGALTRQTAERLVEAATAAPSMHNAQPWRFVARLADRVIDVYADPARTLRRGDPRGRAVHIACGAALFNLRLAVAHAGTAPVARLLPDPRNPLLLARVRLAGPYRPRPSERDLHAAIHPRGARRSTAAPPPLRALLAALLEAAMLEGASLRLLDQPGALRLLQSLTAADRALHPDAGYLAELREFAPRPPGHPAPAGQPAHQLAVITTAADDRASWLRAGQAMQRVLLLAAHRGLAAAPLAPALELPEAPVRPDPRLGAEHAEMIIRLGGGEDPVAAAFRRPVTQVMRVIPALSHQDEGPRAVPPPALPAQARELMRSS